MRSMTQTRMTEITRAEVLAALGDFDGSGGASLSLLAWELVRTPESVAPTWDAAEAEGLIRAVGPGALAGEKMYRLTAGGWDELRRIDRRPRGELRLIG
jgi:hypothetical protein